MSCKKLAFKLLLIQIFTTFILLFASVLFYSIFPNSEAFRWIVGIGYTLVYWYIIIDFTSKYGSYDIKDNKFSYFKGFIAGTIATIPIVIFYFITRWKSLPPLFIRLWLIPYDKLLQTYQDTFPQLSLIVSLIFPIISGIGYILGLSRWKLIKRKIENAKH